MCSSFSLLENLHQQPAGENLLALFLPAKSLGGEGRGARSSQKGEEEISKIRDSLTLLAGLTAAGRGAGLSPRWQLTWVPRVADGMATHSVFLPGESQGPPAFPRNPRGRLGFPGPTQGEGPSHSKMRPLPATASQGKSPVPP